MTATKTMSVKPAENYRPRCTNTNLSSSNMMHQHNHGHKFDWDNVEILGQGRRKRTKTSQRHGFNQKTWSTNWSTWKRSTSHWWIRTQGEQLDWPHNIISVRNRLKLDTSEATRENDRLHRCGEVGGHIRIGSSESKTGRCQVATVRDQLDKIKKITNELLSCSRKSNGLRCERFPTTGVIRVPVKLFSR